MAQTTYRVLLVEDSQAEADLVRVMLSNAGPATYDLAHHTRLSDALDALAADTFDVVLLDLNLPDSKGLEGFKTLHTIRPAVPIVVFSNMGDSKVAAEAVRLGAQDYLVKRDVDEKLLRHVIRYSIARKHTQEALRDSEERYVLAVAGANDGIWDWDIVQGQVYYSPRWNRLLELEDGALGEGIQGWLERVHPDDRTCVDEALQKHLAGESEHFEMEHRLRRGDDGYAWVLARGLAVRGPDGRAYRMAGSLTDITQRKRAERQLLHDAMHDALTGLPNRTLYLDRLGIALRRYRRDNSNQFAVLYFDLNRFKYINDSLGHAIGDQLLVAVARRLQGFLRPEDTLARLGGDEFAVLLTDIEDLSDVTQVAARIHEQLGQEFVLDDHEVFTSASIGVALSADKYERPEELLRDADLAMYKAKHSGAESCEIFDSDMHESALAQLRLETDLRRAMERGELVVHYQPIVAVSDGRIMAFEALLRWNHPQRGLLMPSEFIPVAEETGLVMPLGWWVMEEACRQTRQWQRLFPTDPPLGISVNISGKLFLSPNMAGRLLELMAECELDPRCLRLEITESSIMDHREAALAELQQLREAGVELHLDDFGTGYSSLTYLQRFSYDTLKIDRSFVKDMQLPGENGAIVETLVALGRMLNMNVIAEGVETPEQLSHLRTLSCPEAQGFWFSEPLDQGAVSALLGNGGLARLAARTRP